ncbi:MAG: hypothetical protein H0X24_00830 [Ktedonobacterales bacterium]|nr:hypothetical protein [Ktedonobacterales bacterium]
MHDADATPEALAQSCLAHGFDADDAHALAAAIDRHEVRASLCELQGGGAEDGQQFWLIEQIGGWPPQNWTLPMWRLRHHSPTCGTCGHKSGDTLPACRCICHEVETVLLELDAPTGD